MENVLTSLTLVLLMVIAGIVSRIATTIPTPLVQIFIGAIIGLFFPSIRVELNPGVFMLLFIPPLLFTDSWRFPKREFLLNRRPIIMLSIGLVFFTVFGLGYLVHWLMPTIPLYASVAMAAALSPTDPVALKSMTAKIGIPTRMMHILQGEALLNDASGLVSFKFAVAAMLTGFFSLIDASISLLVIGLGGLAIGIFLTHLFMTILGQLSHKNGEETTTENLLLILLPYSAYLLAEHLGCSGILAAVSAGFTLDRAGFLTKTMVTMRIEGRFVWGMLEVTLNGIIFLLLGLFLPNSFALLAASGYGLVDYLLIVSIISGLLLALRFIWIYLAVPFELLMTHRQQKPWSLPNLNLVAALSFGGIRGAIALAAILSLPTVMPDGNVFPTRDLLITLVVGVVCCSLLISTFMLPWILPKLQYLIPQSPTEEINTARVAAARAGIDAIEQTLQTMTAELDTSNTALCMEVGNALITSLNQFISASMNDERTQSLGFSAFTYEERLRLAALNAARQELDRLRKKGEINNTTMLSVMNHLDLRQISLLKERNNF